jgi:hypothetical protein
MEHILVVIIVGLAVAGFVRKIFMLYRDGDCGCGCDGCGHADRCSEMGHGSADITVKTDTLNLFFKDDTLKGNGK